MSNKFELLYKELLQKYKQLHKHNECLSKKVSELESKLDQKPIMQKRLTIKGDKHIETTFNEVSSIVAGNGGITIKLTDGTSTFLWQSLKKFREQLPPSYFKQISKSCIINAMNIKVRIDQTLEMKNRDKHTISDSYKNTL